MIKKPFMCEVTTCMVILVERATGKQVHWDELMTRDAEKKYVELRCTGAGWRHDQEGNEWDTGIGTFGPIWRRVKDSQPTERERILWTVARMLTKQTARVTTTRDETPDQYTATTKGFVVGKKLSITVDAEILPDEI